MAHTKVPTGRYIIVRRWANGDTRTIKRGLSLEEAQAWCRRPDTIKKDDKGLTVWSDGYDDERRRRL